jgi:hypothetical protein
LAYSLDSSATRSDSTTGERSSSTNNGGRGGGRPNGNGGRRNGGRGCGRGRGNYNNSYSNNGCVMNRQQMSSWPVFLFPGGAPWAAGWCAPWTGCCHRLPVLQLSNDLHTTMRRALEHPTPSALTHTRKHDGSNRMRENGAANLCSFSVASGLLFILALQENAPLPCVKMFVVRFL